MESCFNYFKVRFHLFFLKDRENAENTIQILRERSRTLTNLNIIKRENSQLNLSHVRQFIILKLNTGRPRK